MQQQVGKLNLSTGLAWGNEGGSWGNRSSTPGSGSWTSTANQENSSTTGWQSVTKSDSASDAGDETSSVKSGSAISNISNITTQHSDATATTASGTLQANTSSPWNNATSGLPSIESNPWGTNSPASTSLGSIGWNNTPSSLSLPTNHQGLHNNMQQGSPLVGNNSFNANMCIGPSPSWPPNTSNPTTSSAIPPNSNTGPQSGNVPSQWQGSSMLGTIGDFSKSSEPNWNNTTSSAIDSTSNKENNADPRLWAMSSEKPTETHGQWDQSKPQWGGSAITGAGEQGANSNTQLSFVQATLKGLKVPPVENAPQGVITRNEEILRAIENHDGWGSRPVRQDSSWDMEGSPKSHRKFSTDNGGGASNVWNNSNGTAIWEAVRENQSSNWGGAGPTGNSWNGEKDQTNWGGMPKPAQDPNNWNGGNGNDTKGFGMWGASGPGGAGDASSKMWGQKTEIGSWGEGGNVQRPANISSWGEENEPAGWEDQRRVAGGMGGPMQGMVPPNPNIGGPTGLPGVGPQNIPGMGAMQPVNTDNMPWNEGQKAGWNQPNSVVLQRPKMDEPWNKPPPKVSGWGDHMQEPVKVDDGTGIWASGGPKQMPPPQSKPSGWGDTQQGPWNAAVGAKPKPSGWDQSSWGMDQRAKVLPKYNQGGHHTQMRAKLLQQLMDMGFRKEEAQNALISNNMNIEMAIVDLKNNSGMTRKDLDMDMFPGNGPQPRMPYMPKGGLGNDDMNDSSTRPDQVPPFNPSMQNTPFPNAQLPNQTFMQNNTSLPPSSLNPNSSISSNIQQMMIQKQHPPPPGSAVGPRGQMPPVGPAGPANNQTPSQQYIMAQLRMAVNNGLISQQLLNQHLPHNILVILQQLLQLQATRQSYLSKRQQMAHQGKGQIEQTNSVFNTINQKILELQKQLQQAQNHLVGSQKQPSGLMNMHIQPSGTDNIDAITSEIANTSISQNPQSRLTTHWKSPMDSVIAPPASSGADFTATSSTADIADKHMGANLQSSSPNMNLVPGGLGISGDGTWSSSTTPSAPQNWPTPSSDSTSAIPQGDQKVGVPSSSTSSAVSGMQYGLTDVIPEFVPGKPWQGLTKSSVEDDPHITPGSIQRSLSVNKVHDESLNNLSGLKLSTSVAPSNAAWGNMKTDNSLGLGHLGNRPPPGMAPAKVVGPPQWQSGAPYNRQASWGGRSGNSAFTQVGVQNWGDSQNQMSSWILLKNLNANDSATIRALSQRHGEVLNFFYIFQDQAALVQYANPQIANNARRALNNFQMGSTAIIAEFISENSAQRYAQPPLPPQQSAMSHINSSQQWPHVPPTSANFHNAGGRGDPWSRGGDPWGGGSGIWGDMAVIGGDHNPTNLTLSNILD